MNNLNIILLNLFMLLYPWGRFFDKLFIGDVASGDKGITTLLLLIIVIVGILNKDLYKGLNKMKNKIWLLIFMILTFFAVAISNTPEKLFSDYINLIIYFLLIFIIVGLNPNLNQIKYMVKLLLISTFIMSLLSLIDYFNFFDIPFFNDSVSNVRVADSVVFDLTGPFTSRTDIGFNLALIIFLPLLLLFSKKISFINIIVYGFIFLTLVATSYFSNSRSIFFSLFVCTLYYLIFRFKKFRLSRTLFYFVFLYLLLLFLPSFSINNFIADSVLLSRDFGHLSDLTRYNALIATLNDIVLSPLGAGLGYVYLEQSGTYNDVHNSYTYLLRAGGFLGMISIFIFFSPLIKAILKFKFSIDEAYFMLPVLCILLFGFFHTSIQFPTFWILLSFYFSLKFNNEYKNI